MSEVYDTRRLSRTSDRIVTLVVCYTAPLYGSYEWITFFKFRLGHLLSVFLEKFGDFGIKLMQRHGYGALYRVMFRMFVQTNKVRGEFYTFWQAIYHASRLLEDTNKFL